MPGITREHLSFLKELKQHNDRSWFAKNKTRYEKIHREVKIFFQELYEELQKTDSISQFHMHRIYRDLRFSKDKTPYKTHFRLHLGRAKPLLRGGYYLNIEPGNSVASGGFRDPNSKDLLRIRKAFVYDVEAIRAVLDEQPFKKYFGQLRGAELITTPKGFDVAHPARDLLKKKQFIARRLFTDDEVVEGNFLKEVTKTFKALRPFFDYMSEVLTTDDNGAPLYG